MRSLLLFLLWVASTQATFGLLANLFGGGCGPCGGGGGGMYGGGGYGGDYGAGYGGSYGSPMGMGMNAPGSYFQPMGQTLYAGQSYFTPADGGYGGMGSSYGGSYGGGYGGSYGASSPVYTQILPLPANAQIVNNIPYMPQAAGGSYAQPSYRQPLPIPRARPSSYVQPQVEEPAPPPPPPPPPAEEGYVQPAAPVRPYESVPHAAAETAPPAEAPAAANESEDYSETETETQAPAVETTTNYAAAASHQETNEVHMINSPEEAGYRKVLKRRLVRKKTLA